MWWARLTSAPVERCERWAKRVMMRAPKYKHFCEVYFTAREVYRYKGRNWPLVCFELIHFMNFFLTFLHPFFLDSVKSSRWYFINQSRCCFWCFEISVRVCGMKNVKQHKHNNKKPEGLFGLLPSQHAVDDLGVGKVKRGFVCVCGVCISLAWFPFFRLLDSIKLAWLTQHQDRCGKWWGFDCNFELTAESQGKKETDV